MRRAGLNSRVFGFASLNKIRGSAPVQQSLPQDTPGHREVAYRAARPRRQEGLPMITVSVSIRSV